MKLFKYILFLILSFFIGIAIYFGTQEGEFSVENRCPSKLLLSWFFKNKLVITNGYLHKRKSVILWGYYWVPAHFFPGKEKSTFPGGN